MGKSLLLADDSVTIQKVVGLSFASEDISITTVDNGDDAVARARESMPDIILADVVMPGMSGYEVCEAVKADPSIAHIPVLLLTGTFEAFDDARAAQVGAAGHVAKPFEAQTLVDRVKELLASAPAAAAAVPPPIESPELEMPAQSVAPATVLAMPPTPSVEAPVATAPPAAQAPSSFDFFDEPSSESASSAPVGDGDGAFSFGEDDLAPAAPEVSVPAADDFLPPVPAGLDGHTVAIMPPVPTVTDPAAGEGFEFEFEGVSPSAPTETPAPPAPTQIAEASLMDPAGDPAFDVSSGELEFAQPTETPAPAPATQLMTPDMLEPSTEDVSAASNFEGVPSLDADPVMELLSNPQLPPEAQAEFVDAVPESPQDPFDATEADMEPIAVAEPVPAFDAEPIDALAPESADDLAQEPAFDSPDSSWPESPAEPEPIPESVLEVQNVEAAAVPDADAILEQISPLIREQLHETLEKIAWESFGQVTETIVEHAVERIEKAAWEVVPKLAETLILEEIRKLKGE